MTDVIREPATADRDGNARIGELLVAAGVLRPDEVAAALAGRLPRVDVAAVVPSPTTIELVPSWLAARHGVLPLRVEDDELVVATDDPSDVNALDDVRMVSGVRVVRPEVASTNALALARRRVYGDRSAVDGGAVDGDGHPSPTATTPAEATGGGGDDAPRSGHVPGRGWIGRRAGRHPDRGRGRLARQRPPPLPGRRRVACPGPCRRAAARRGPGPRPPRRAGLLAGEDPRPARHRREATAPGRPRTGRGGRHTLRPARVHHADPRRRGGRHPSAAPG